MAPGSWPVLGDRSLPVAEACVAQLSDVVGFGRIVLSRIHPTGGVAIEGFFETCGGVEEMSTVCMYA